MYTYATVCSGVEGCSLALDGMGWKPIFFSEIEPFPCAVLKSRWPDVPNFGDMSKISYKDGIITNGKRSIPFHGRLDLLAGGTPCQDFSVAGKRAGGQEGSGTRSSLMWEWLRLAREFQPRVLFWENVVGTFSSNGGRDFYELVRAIDALGYCVSWRVLDAQYTRVDRWPMAIPQRRRRVWVVGCLGADVGEIAKILFEPQSSLGDTPPRRRTRKEAAGASQNRNSLYAQVVGGAYPEIVNFPNGLTTVDFALHYDGPRPAAGECVALDGDKLKPRDDQKKGGNGFGINEDGAGYTLTSVDRHGCAYKVSSTGKDVASTLSADGGSQSGQDYKNNSVVEAFRIDPLSSNSMKSSNPDSGIHQVESAQTLDTTIPTPAKNQGGDMVVECFENHPHDSRIKSTGDCCQTITQKCGTGGGNLPLVVGTLDLMGGKAGAHCGDGETSPTLTHGRGSASDVHAVVTGMAQNTRDEVRIVGDGNVAGCLAAEPGMKQQTYVVSQGLNGYHQTLSGDVCATICASRCDIESINGVVSAREDEHDGLDASYPRRS